MKSLSHFPIRSYATQSLALMLTLSLAACTKTDDVPHPGATVTPAVKRTHAEVAKAVDLSDPSAFEDARRGFIAAPSGQVKNAQGQVIWDYDAFAFVKGPAPETVNPSLWRQALLNNHIGLFKVTDHIWQLRGFDLANITLIEGSTGWIVIDTLTSRETASAAMAFARRILGNKPVSAIIFTHSHVDHFGGALGVISAEDAKARHIPIVAPTGFMEEATSENIMMGGAMPRRSMYMYGDRLPRNAEGLVDTGLGKAVAYGQVGILEPTVLIDKNEQTMLLDGVRFVFHSVPGSEAPAEITMALPTLNAFGGSELMSQTLHNLYTLRGAKVRDALKWAEYLDKSQEWVADAEVVFNQHHWPVWGKNHIHDFITRQRDVYRYIHDQTVRQINAGQSAAEIAETIQLPGALQEHLNVHGYYGTVRHNVKAVYQYYMGWFDGNPANLDPIPPVEAGKRYVALAGGKDKVLALAKQAYDAGEFRWAAELLKHAVYADPSDQAARELMAESFEQMGYMAESAPWRNFYLTGASELRHGTPEQGITLELAWDMLRYTPIERFFERIAASLNGPKANGVNLTINFAFSDLRENYVLQIENAVLHFRKAPPAREASATLTLTKDFFLKMMMGKVSASDLLLSNQVRIEGSRFDLAHFFLLIDKAPGNFPIVTR